MPVHARCRVRITSGSGVTGGVGVFGAQRVACACAIAMLSALFVLLLIAPDGAHFRAQAPSDFSFTPASFIDADALWRFAAFIVDAPFDVVTRTKQFFTVASPTPRSSSNT